jgi:hypothetical protein
MRKLSWIGPSCVAFVLLGACGGSSDDDGGGGDSLALGDLPRALAEAQCGLYQKCLGDLYAIFLGAEDCVTVTERRVENGELAQLEAAVSAGEVKYDGLAARACLDEIAARSCDALLERETEACDKAVEGNVAAGGECDFDFQCQGQAFCKITGSACPGACTNRQPAGSSCTDDDHCADGLVCSEQTSACTAPAGETEACEGASAPPCAPGLLCIGEDETAGTPGSCKTASSVFVAAVGEACSFQTGPLCVSSAACTIDDLATLSGTCAAKAASGAACKRASIPAQCPDDQYCEGSGANPDGICTALPGDGQPCVEVLGEQRCAAYARCENGTCRNMQTNGGACATGAVCYSGVCQGGACRASECAE